jgi:MFS family permease
MTTGSPSISNQRLSLDFWKFWAGQTISNLGSSITLFALPLLVFKLTGSALDLAIASATSFLPYLLFGLIIGAWVDRLNRKRLMIVVDVARTLAIASIPLVNALGLLSVWWIYAVGFISATLTIAFDAAEFAAIPSLVRRDDSSATSGQALVAANGRIQASYSAAQVAGPLLAGLLVAFVPIAALLLLDAASFLVSALALALIRIGFNAGGTQQRPKTSIRRDIEEGLRYVLIHPVLRNISLMMALVNFIGSTTYAQLVLFAKERLGASDSQVGLLFSAGSVGVVALSLVAGALRKRWSFSRVALSALMLSGLLTIALAWTRLFWAAVPLWALISGLGILFNINTGSLRQAIVPNDMLGRVISIAGVLAWSAIPLGTFLGGLLIEWTGDVALIYGAIGVLVTLIPIGFAFTPLGRAERYILEAEAAAEPESVGAMR